VGKLIKIAKIGVLSLAALAVLALLGLSLPIDGRRAFSVQTGSMEPAVKAGSLVFVNRIPAADIAAGDVITYINPKNTKQTITHRVLEVRKQPNGPRRFVTQGDANSNPDLPISESRVVGKVDAVVPYAGRAVDTLWHPIGLAFLIYVPALIVVISEVRRLAAHYRKQRYALPDMLARRFYGNFSRLGRNLSVIGLVGLFTVAAALPVRAAFMSTAALTGNTISVAGVPDPEPEPEPEPTPAGEGDVTLRRVFVACESDEDKATHVQIILYNSREEAINASGWYIQSGTDKLITFPDETLILARSLFDAETSIVEGISYSKGSLTLHNQEGEQIDEHSWELNTTRECRVRI
jgi:signal peptidase I